MKNNQQDKERRNTSKFAKHAHSAYAHSAYAHSAYVHSACVRATRSERIRAAMRLLAATLVAMLFLPACGAARDATAGNATAGDAAAEGAAPKWADLSAFTAPDLSGYEGLQGYEEPLQFVEMTVADSDVLMKQGESFVLLLSFANCPWCNAMISYLNDVAIENNATIALIDTRKDPSWQSNLDLLDYDLFVEDFGAYLEEDEDGIPHLYVPHVFFIKEGKVVYEHQGALPEMGSDPKMELDETQQEALREIYREGFRASEIHP